MEILVEKFNNSLSPVENFNLDSLKNNEVYKVTIKKCRNVRFHRQFFGLLNKFCDANGIDNVENFRKVYTMKAGYYDIVETPKGCAYIPVSIDFEKMDNAEFEKFYHAFNVVLYNDFKCNLDDCENTK